MDQPRSIESGGSVAVSGKESGSDTRSRIAAASSASPGWLSASASRCASVPPPPPPSPGGGDGGGRSGVPLSVHVRSVSCEHSSSADNGTLSESGRPSALLCTRRLELTRSTAPSGEASARRCAASCAAGPRPMVALSVSRLSPLMSARRSRSVAVSTTAPDVFVTSSAACSRPTVAHGRHLYRSSASTATSSPHRSPMRSRSSCTHWSAPQPRPRARSTSTAVA